jgi:uncharacterized protein YbjT (DUF2867 family)
MKNAAEKKTILVTGGSGYLGQEVCNLLININADFITSTHQRGSLTDQQVFVDLETGDGIKDAIQGKTVILHLASDKKKPDNDVEGMKHLIAEIKKQQSKVHLIYISIVGIDLLPMPYFKQKMMAEQELVNSGVNWSILRATQFHKYVDELLHQFLAYPVGIIPKAVPVQPIDVHVVAEKLVEMTAGVPSHQKKDMGGEEVFEFIELAKSWGKIRHKSKLILNFPLWGRWGKNLKNGALTTADKSSSGMSWESWLTAEYANYLSR